MERTYIDTLAQLIARSPTCYHAAATAAELLAAAGYAPLDEGQRWQLRPGGKYYMTRGRLPSSSGIGILFSSPYPHLQLSSGMTVKGF